MAKIAFIGGGKMAEALIAGQKNHRSIIVADVNSRRLTYLKKKYGVKTTKSNQEAFAGATIVVLAVKPQNMADIIINIQSSMINQGRNKLIISIAAGVTLKYLQQKLPGLPIVRVMPNNPCLVGMGMSVLSKGKLVNKLLSEKAAAIFKAVGEVVWLPEKDLDAVTGLSGSGPAFVYQTVQALAEGGVAAGLKQKIATKLALQTILGALAVMVETEKAPDQLIALVASKGGTTIEGLKVLKRGKFKQVLASAVLAAAEKSKKLSKKL